ncbi:MAG: protein phosphatase 2C domain-containing protein [Oculatellaceae cyanobacterium Prado106]|nr:protein phosphatase 2C domain-containing protein [Oculatellaceae cyanobacterium Prado106]
MTHTQQRPSQVSRSTAPVSTAPVPTAPVSTATASSEALVHRSPFHLQCANPECQHPANDLGKRLCDRCHQPLVYRYVWAIGAKAAQFEAGTFIAHRYVVMSPQIWLDTQPLFPPEVPNIPDEALPYLHLYRHRLHLPNLHGFCPTTTNSPPIFLLDNAPINESGILLPSLQSVWKGATTVRQVYWLWQMLQLWTPLKQQGVSNSLLVAENLRVEGWRIRLRELIPDPVSLEPSPELRDLANFWLTWVSTAHPSIAETLQNFCYDLQTVEETQADLQSFGIPIQSTPTGTVPPTIAHHLNQILLEEAAQQPLHLDIVGATTTGPKRGHNEDACFPAAARVKHPLLPHVAIVCDGIGGHEGGEVASQLAMNSLQLQLRVLLEDYQAKSEPVSPAVVTQQLSSMVRVANNMIAARNDAQGRSSRQRMGTTLVMAVQLPQQVMTPKGLNNAHELYLVNVGDSRAYWLTPSHCVQLTVDDDVLTREVSLGRQLYQEAVLRPDAGGLSQAMGTRDADLLHPRVQRFVVEEDGLLLLCSDGLSDGDRIEQFWQQTTGQALRGDISLEQATQNWIAIANEQNGHDNTSVVLMRCRVTHTDEFDAETDLPLLETANPELLSEELADFTAASRALLYDDLNPGAEQLSDRTSTASSTRPAPREQSRVSRPWLLTAGIALMMFILGGVGIALWQQLDPTGFRQTVLRQPSAPETQPTEPQNLPRFLINHD